MSGPSEVKGARAGELNLSSAATLAELAQRMRKYFLTVQAAHAFLIFGSFATAYWLLVVAVAALFDAWGRGLFWLASMLTMILLFILIGYTLSLASPKVSSRVWRERGRFAALIFAAPFIVAYALPQPPQFHAIVWYPALSVALLLQHLVYEREEYRQGEIAARPFLLSSLIGLATSPLVLAAAAVSFTAGWTLALSLMLLSYSIAGLAALHGARKQLGS